MYPLVMTGLLLGTSTLGDRYGHKRVFLLGIALFGLASLIAAFSPTPGVLIFSRALLAVGAALMLPATLAIIRITFDDERERNIAITVWSSASLGGIAFGPLVGGLLLEWFWWGSVFLINVPIAPRQRSLTRPWLAISDAERTGAVVVPAVVSVVPPPAA